MGNTLSQDGNDFKFCILNSGHSLHIDTLREKKGFFKAEIKFYQTIYWKMLPFSRRRKVDENKSEDNFKQNSFLI